jgi:hypothetical protein
LEVFLFEPEKAHRQLPQVIPVVTNRQFVRSHERVGSESPERRGILIRPAFHGY